MEPTSLLIAVQAGAAALGVAGFIASGCHER